MGKIIKFIFNIKPRLKKIKENYQNILNQYVDFLDNGVYKINSSCTVFYNVKFKRQIKKDQHNMTKHRFRFSINSLSTTIKRLFFSKYIKLKVYSSQKTFYGHSVYFTTLGNETRFVNFKEQTLLTIFNDKNRMALVLDKRNNFAKYFNTPKILLKDDNAPFIIEEYKNRKKINNEKCFLKAMTDVLSYQQNNNYIKTDIPFSKEIYNKFDIELKRLNLGYADKVYDFIKKGFYKKRLCHGDLTRFNIIFDGREYYYIDYELCGECLFFFDILSYIFVEAFRFHNYKLYNNYIKGKYDSYLFKLFQINNVVYNPAYKKLYFFIMLVEYWHLWNTYVPKECEKLIT